MTNAKKLGVSVIITTGVTTFAVFAVIHALDIKSAINWLAVVFPFAALTSLIQRREDMFMLAVALLQFPIYGAIVGRAWLRCRLPRTAFTISALHLLAALIVFTTLALEG